MGLIADPLDGNLHGRHCMVLTAKGLAALGLADTEDAEPDIDTGFRIISGSSVTLPLGRCEIYRRRRISGSMRIADLELASREVRKVLIVLKKSFWGDERKFLEPLMRFARGDMRDHIVSYKNDHGASYRRYGVFAVAESPKNQLLRDFRHRSIFDFCIIGTFETWQPALTMSVCSGQRK
jgi:hypothetical protein